MSSLKQDVASLRRPGLLVRAARIGAPDYRRERDLCRITGGSRPPAPATAVATLLDREGALEAIRLSGDASYSVAQHIDVLIALMMEARALPEAG